MSREDLLRQFSSFSRKRRVYTAEDDHADAMSRGALCKQCTLYGQKQGPVRGEIRPGCKLTAVGEAPGRVEVETGTTFAWKSGEELDLSLEQGGLTRADCTIVNCAECRPPQDMTDYVQRIRRNPPKDAAGNTLLDPLTACRPRLYNDLETAGASTLLAVGAHALGALAARHGLPYADRKASREGKPFVATIMNQHGAPVQVPDSDVIICSTLHPAFAMREWAYRDEVRENIARAARIAVRGYIDWREPEGCVFPSFAELESIVGQLRRAQVLTVDIETDGVDIMRTEIRCVGIGGLVPNEQSQQLERLIVVVPYRRANGDDYWPPHRQRQVRAMVRDLFRASQLAFHNANFDVLILEREGFIDPPRERRGSLLLQPHDTLLMDRNTRANGMSHKLGDVAKRYFELRLWKTDLDLKDSDGVDEDEILYKYNVGDVAVQDMLFYRLQQEINACGTQHTYDIDRSLAPIAREMTSLGIPIDEVYRGQLSEAYNKESVRLRQELNATLGRELNPRSSEQVGEWLFDPPPRGLGLAPPINTDGKKYQEGDDWATSVPALFALIETGLTPQVERAVKLILDCRTCDTIKTRYVNGLRTYVTDRERDLTAYGMADAVHWNGEEVLPRRPAISIVHPSWNIGTTPTGRWTSRPNCQNAPSRAWAVDIKGNGERETVNTRRLFRAPPGHKFVAADFDQAELRLYAAIAEDELLLESYEKGLDAHTFNLATMMSKSLDEVPRLYDEIQHKQEHGSAEEKNKLKFLRTVAKRLCFLILYGGQFEKLFSTLKSERDKSNNTQTFASLEKARAKLWYDRWHEHHPYTRQWHERVNAELRRQGYVSDYLHDRRRFYPDGVSNDTSHINHKVQTAAASLANNATIAIAEEIPFRSWSPWTGLVIQCHDELIVCVPENKAERAKQILEGAMYSKHPNGRIEFTATADVTDYAAH